MCLNGMEYIYDKAQQEVSSARRDSRGREREVRRAWTCVYAPRCVRVYYAVPRGRRAGHGLSVGWRCM